MSKIILITGVTGAIGKATALELAKANCQVILAGRNLQKLDLLRTELVKITGNTQVECIVIDLSEPVSVKRAAAEIKSRYNSLNAIINVAAIFKSTRELNSRGYEIMFSTNQLGPFLLTNELLDLLKLSSPSRVVTVSAPSFTKINFDDLHGEKKFSSGFTGSFGASKMMNIMFTYALARRLEGTGVAVSVFHPGLVKSELTSEMPAFLNFIFKQISSKPEKAAQMLCQLAIDPKFEKSNGRFLNKEAKDIKSNEYSHNIELQEKLWTICEQLTR